MWEKLSTNCSVLIQLPAGLFPVAPRLDVDSTPETRPPEKVILGMSPRPVGEPAGQPVLNPYVAACGPG